MHNWRLLLFALLAAIQPIASYTERNFIDGLQECCDRQPHTLLRDTRLLYGIHRFSKSTPDDRGLNQQEKLRIERRYEVRKSIINRQSSDILILENQERNTRHLTRYLRSENSFERINENRERFSPIGDAPRGSVRDTKDDFNKKISRERITREHGRDSFESYKMSRDENRITGLENERYSRISGDSRRETRPMQISITHDLERGMNVGTRTEFSINKQNNRDMAREHHTERRQPLIRSELWSQMDFKRERRSLDRRVSERNDISRRSLSLEARISRVRNIREDARENIRVDIREGREHIINLRPIGHQQRDVKRMQRDGPMSARSSNDKQEREELSRATRNSDRQSTFVQNHILKSSDRFRMVNIRGITENARHSRTNIKKLRLERDSRVFRHFSNERSVEYRQEIRDPKTRSTRVSSEEKERSSNNRLGRTDQRRAQDSSHVNKQPFTRNRYNTRVERWSTAETRKENEQFSENRKEIISEDRRNHLITARVVRNRQGIRSVERKLSGSPREDERVSKIHQERRTEKRSLRVGSLENSDRLSKIRQDIRRDERRSSAATRAQNELLSKNRQEFRNEKTLSRQDITRFIDNPLDVSSVERQSSVIRDKNIRCTRNRQTKNIESFSIEASRENVDRPQTRNTKRHLPSAIREENFSQYRYEIKNYERRSLMTSQEELPSNRKEEGYNEGLSRNANRMESERFSSHRKIVSDGRRSQVDRKQNRESLINRQEIRNNERYSRLAPSDERDVRRDTLRMKERQTSHSHDSVVDRSRSANSLETVRSRSLELIGRVVRLDKRHSQVDRHENGKSLINRQEIRNNERYSRLAPRDDRHVRRDTLRTKESQTSRSHDSVVDRIRSANSLETVRSRSVEFIGSKVRPDERRSQVDIYKNSESPINRQEIRYNKSYSPLAPRNNRDVRRDTLRTKERQTSRSHDSAVDRSRSANFRENARSAETIGKDIDSRTRNLMDRELVNGYRNSEITRSREILEVKNLKMQSEQPIFDVNWQMVLYTLQGIYLCSFLMQMVTDNTRNTTKSRSLSWLALPSQNLFKMD